MLFYFSLIILPLSLNLFYDNKIKVYLRFLLLFILFILIGFRHEVGGDFYTYVRGARLANYYTALDDTLIDIIYYISYNFLNLGIYGFQLICCLIFLFSLHKFLSRLKYYELGLIIFVPIGLIIGAMGYIAQTLALSFGLLAINAILGKKIFNYFIFIILSTLSHIAGAFFLIFFFAIYTIKKENIFKIFIIILSVILIIYLTNMDRLNMTFYWYLGEGKHFSSTGVLPRYLLSLIPAIIFLFYIKNKLKNNIEKNIYTIYSYVTLILLPLIFTASSFVDRINLFIIPLQAFVITSLISHVHAENIKKFIYAITVFLYSFVMLIWFIFGTHSKLWLPYKFFPLQYCVSSYVGEKFCDYFNYDNTDTFNWDENLRKKIRK